MWFVLIVSYFIFGYMPLNWISQYRVRFFDVSLPFEQHIPFIPVFIFGYLLVYLSLVYTHYVINDIGSYRRAMVSFVLTITACYLFFIFFPVRATRPDLSNATGFCVEVTKFYYFIDKPYNLFPSLHVAYPMLGTLLTWRHHHIARIILALATVVTAVSVVLVKQHYIMDVIAGAVIATLSYKLATATERYWSGWFRLSSGERA